MIDLQWDTSCEESEATVGHGKLMCARGLLMLMHLENLEDFNMFEVTFQLCETILKVTEMHRHSTLAEQTPFI